MCRPVSDYVCLKNWTKTHVSAVKGVGLCILNNTIQQVAIKQDGCIA